MATKLRLDQILLEPYAWEGTVAFFISVAPTIHGKIGKKSWKQWNQEFILFFQRVNIRAELLLCYTLLGLERTSWSPAHIFHSLTCSLTWAACISAATKSCDRLTSVEIVLHILHPLGFQTHHSKSNILPLPLSQMSAFPYPLIKKENPGSEQNKEEGRRHLSSISSCQLHQWRGGVGAGAGVFGKSWVPSVPGLKRFSEAHQWSHSCLDLLMAGRCPPVPGADLHSSTGLVWGGEWRETGRGRKEEEEEEERKCKQGKGGENET